jgi:hypothetical protein
MAKQYEIASRFAHIRSWNLDGEPKDPSREVTDPAPVEPPRPSPSGFGFGGSVKGFDSVTGVRAGPDRMTGTPLIGRIGVPRAR